MNFINKITERTSESYYYRHSYCVRSIVHCAYPSIDFPSYSLDKYNWHRIYIWYAVHIMHIAQTTSLYLGIFRKLCQKVLNIHFDVSKHAYLFVQIQYEFILRFWPRHRPQKTSARLLVFVAKRRIINLDHTDTNILFIYSTCSMVFSVVLHERKAYK